MGAPVKHAASLEEIAAGRRYFRGRRADAHLSRLAQTPPSGPHLHLRRAGAGIGSQPEGNCRMSRALQSDGFTSRSYAPADDSFLSPTPSDAVYPSDQTGGIPLCNYPRRIAGVRSE